MSPREQVAHNLADTCVCGGLNESYGVNVTKANQPLRSYWVVSFAKTRVLDGSIRVYSPKFILVKWQTSFRNMPARGQEKFTSEHEAKTFITEKFIKSATRLGGLETARRQRRLSRLND